MYQIYSKNKYSIIPKFEIEKFLTGGKTFLTFKNAQETRKKLQKMSSSITYKVVKLQ